MADSWDTPVLLLQQIGVIVKVFIHSIKPIASPSHLTLLDVVLASINAFDESYRVLSSNNNILGEMSLAMTILGTLNKLTSYKVFDGLIAAPVSAPDNLHIRSKNYTLRLKHLRTELRTWIRERYVKEGESFRSSPKEFLKELHTFNQEVTKAAAYTLPPTQDESLIDEEILYDITS